MAAVTDDHKLGDSYCRSFSHSLKGKRSESRCWLGHTPSKDSRVLWFFPLLVALGVLWLVATQIITACVFTWTSPLCPSLFSCLIRTLLIGFLGATWNPAWFRLKIPNLSYICRDPFSQWCNSHWCEWKDVDMSSRGPPFNPLQCSKPVKSGRPPRKIRCCKCKKWKNKKIK